jgi:hypothetical protein
MEESKFNEYLDKRYHEQISWCENKSSENKKGFIFFQWSVIILSALIPVLTVSLSTSYKWFTAGLGVLLAIGTAGLKSFKYHENWINFRSIAETLKKEKYFYDAKIEGYFNSPDSEAHFIERVEAIISRENSLWICIQQAHDDKKGKS